MVGAYLVVCYGASLRGNEGLFVEGSALVELIQLGRSCHKDEAHVCIPLLGRFKSEISEDKHVAVIASVTKSGVNVRLWVERLVWVLMRERKHKEW